MTIEANLKHMGKGWFLAMLAHECGVSLWHFEKIESDPYYKEKLNIYNKIKENGELETYFKYIEEHFNFGMRCKELFLGSNNLKELIKDIKESGYFDK